MQPETLKLVRPIQHLAECFDLAVAGMDEEARERFGNIAANALDSLDALVVELKRLTAEHETLIKKVRQRVRRQRLKVVEAEVALKAALRRLTAELEAERHTFRTAPGPMLTAMQAAEAGKSNPGDGEAVSSAGRPCEDELCPEILKERWESAGYTVRAARAEDALREIISMECPDGHSQYPMADCARRALFAASLEGHETGQDKQTGDDRSAVAGSGGCPLPSTSNLPARIVVGANGAYWRDFGDWYSMCPVSTDNDPVEVFAVYERIAPSEETSTSDAKRIEDELSAAQNMLRTIAGMKEREPNPNSAVGFAKRYLREAAVTMTTYNLKQVREMGWLPPGSATVVSECGNDGTSCRRVDCGWPLSGCAREGSGGES